MQKKQQITSLFGKIIRLKIQLHCWTIYFHLIGMSSTINTQWHGQDSYHLRFKNWHSIEYHTEGVTDLPNMKMKALR